MTREKLWRPADHPALAIYVPPPQTRASWEFGVRDDRGSAERGGAQLGRHQRSSGGLAHIAWNIVAWAFTCGLVAGIAGTVVAVFVVHLV